MSFLDNRQNLRESNPNCARRLLRSCSTRPATCVVSGAPAHENVFCRSYASQTQPEPRKTNHILFVFSQYQQGRRVWGPSHSTCVQKYCTTQCCQCRARNKPTSRFSMMRFSGLPTRASIQSSSASSSVMRWKRCRTCNVHQEPHQRQKHKRLFRKRQQQALLIRGVHP